MDILKLATCWLKRRKTHEDYIRLQRFRAEHLRRNLLRKYDSKTYILDVGSHRGGYANELAKNFHVFGVEIDFDKIKTAQNEKVKNKTNVEFVCADATKLPFKKDAFDFILLSNIIEHVVNTDSLMHECYRILKRNALAYINYPPYWSIFGGHFYYKSLALPLPLHYIPKQLTKYFVQQENIQKLAVQKFLKICKNNGFKIKNYCNLLSRIPLINEIWPLFEVVLRK